MSTRRSARESLRDWLASNGVDLALRLTLLLLLLQPVGREFVRPLVLLLAAVGLLHTGVLRSPWTWLALTGLTATRVVASWPLADNHAYLLSYWCGLVFLARTSPEPARTLALGARLLIGLVFAFAVLWKGVLSPDFLDTRFFRVLLLTDPRFEELSLWLGGMTADELHASRDYLLAPRGVPGSTLPLLSEPAALRRAAAWMTWTTLRLETLVAVLFMAPLPAPAVPLRHAVLLAFCVGTYALAPVEGFGWLLLAMGTAACPDGATRLRGLYLATFALLIAYRELGGVAALLS